MSYFCVFQIIRWSSWHFITYVTNVGNENIHELCKKIVEIRPYLPFMNYVTEIISKFILKSKFKRIYGRWTISSILYILFSIFKFWIIKYKLISNINPFEKINFDQNTIFWICIYGLKSFFSLGKMISWWPK